ncbi:MAG: hypothetical protein JO164_13950, partial [Candidatus Eremiobacteraeota bacterium]|nr:hypothetical protein [Candidatus Eremiobacteraeota bacterium]
MQAPYRWCALGALALVAGCGGGAASSMPRAPHRTASAQIVVHWTAPVSGQAALRRPRFVSASAQSIEIDVAAQGSTSPAGTLRSVVNRPTSGSISTLAIDAPVGADTFTFVVYDKANATGATLGGTTLAQTIASGVANTVSATLTGYARSFAWATTDIHFRPAGTAPDGLARYSVLGQGNTTVVVTPLDADGNAILGYTPPIGGSLDNGAFTVAPVASHNGTYTLRAIAQLPTLGEPRLIFTATNPDGTVASSSFALSENAIGFGASGTGASATITAFDVLGNLVPAATGTFVGLQKPIGLALNEPAGVLYVADAGTGSILAFDESGAPAPGWTAPAVPNVTAVAFSPDNQRVYATTSANGGAVLAFDTTGAPIALNGTFAGLTAAPVGIAVGRTFSNVAVVQAGNPGYLTTYNESGGLLLTKTLTDNLNPNNDVHTFAPTGVISASGGYTFTQQDYFWLAGTDSGRGTPTGAMTFYAHSIGLPRIYLEANEPTTTSGE